MRAMISSRVSSSPCFQGPAAIEDGETAGAGSWRLSELPFDLFSGALSDAGEGRGRGGEREGREGRGGGRWLSQHGQSNHQTTSHYCVHGTASVGNDRREKNTKRGFSWITDDRITNYY